MLALDPSLYFNRYADRTEHVDTVLEGGDDDDQRLLVELSDIVDAMFIGAVAAHVGGTVGQWRVASGEYGWWHFACPTA